MKVKVGNQLTSKKIIGFNSFKLLLKQHSGLSELLNISCVAISEKCEKGEKVEKAEKGEKEEKGRNWVW
jgi:hypothetical protein